MNQYTQNPQTAASPAQPFAVPSRPKTPAHIRVPHDWMAHWLPQIGASAFAVYAVLLKRRGANESAWPSHADIAAQSGLSVPTVKRALKKLAEHGLCSWQHRTETTKHGRQRQTSNDYVLACCDLPSPSKNEPSPQVKKSDKQKAEKKRITESTNSARAENVVASSISSNVIDLTQKLIQIGVNPTTAAKYAEENAEAVEKSLAALPYANAARPAAWIVAAIQRGGYEAPQSREAAPQSDAIANGGAYSAYSNEAKPTELKSDSADKAALRARAAAHVEACLALLPAPLRLAAEIGVSEKGISMAAYLRNFQPREWSEARGT